MMRLGGHGGGGAIGGRVGAGTPLGERRPVSDHRVTRPSQVSLRLTSRGQHGGESPSLWLISSCFLLQNKRLFLRQCEDKNSLCDFSIKRATLVFRHTLFVSLNDVMPIRNSF